MSIKPKKIAAFLLSLILFLVILFAIFSTRINHFIEGYAHEKLVAILNEEPDRLYDISYDSLRIDIYSGDIRVWNFSIIPRQEILDSMYLNHIPSKFVIDFRLGDFNMEDIALLKLFRTGRIEVESIQLGKINGILYWNDTIEVKSGVSDDILSNQFVSILFEKIELTEGKIEMYSVSSDTSHVLLMDSIYIAVEDLYSDSSMINMKPAVSMAGIQFRFEDFYAKPLRDYDVSVDYLTFDSYLNKLSITGSKMIPSADKISSENFFKLEAGEIDIEGIDYDSLLEKDMFRIQKLFVGDPVFDYNRPPQKLQKDTLRFLPAVTFKRIPVPLHIDTLQLENGSFNYFKQGYGEPLLYFDMSDIHIYAYNFASDPDLMEASKSIDVGGHLLFFGQTPVKMDFNFPMTDYYNAYTIRGVIDTLDGVRLNQIIKNPFKMRVSSGTFNQMAFAIQGSDTVVHGDFEVSYENLKLESLRIDSRDFTETKREGFKTFLVNTLAKKKNDPASSSFHKGIIYLERDDHMTFLDLNLTALLNGLVTSIIPEAKTFMVPREERKVFRQEIKEERKEKRQEANTEKKPERR